MLVLVNGPPCAGKSHLTEELAAATSLPIMTKDMIKETVYDSAGWSDRDWSRRLGTAASALLWKFAHSLISQGWDCLIESNFRASLAAQELDRLASALKFTSAQIFVTAAALLLLVQRFRHVLVRVPAAMSAGKTCFFYEKVWWALLDLNQ